MTIKEYQEQEKKEYGQKAFKVVNYHKDNYSTDKEGTVYRGHIEMTAKDYSYILAMLEHMRTFDTYLPNLYPRCNTPIAKNIYSIGVTATKYLFDRYYLPRYKEQNYLIKITK